MEFLEQIRKILPDANLNNIEKKIAKKTLENVANKFKKDKTFLKFYCNIRNLGYEKRIEKINKYLDKYGSYEMSLDEVGLIMGITRERVRQIEENALRKIKNIILQNKEKYKDIKLFLFKKEDDY